jgi:hypothetical protein
MCSDTFLDYGHSRCVDGPVNGGGYTGALLYTVKPGCTRRVVWPNLCVAHLWSKHILVVIYNNLLIIIVHLYLNISFLNVKGLS